MARDFPLKVGGKELLLRINMDACEYLESTFGSSLDQELQGLKQGKITSFVRLMQVALMKHHPDVKASDVFDDVEYMEDAIQPLGEAVNSFLSRMQARRDQPSKKKTTRSTTQTEE